MQSLRLGDVTVDPATGEMAGPGGREQLDPKVVQVLLVLARHAGEVVPRQELLDQVWPGVVVGDDVVSRCIYQLRRHLRQAAGDARYAAMVETLPKRGYRLNGEGGEDADAASAASGGSRGSGPWPRWRVAVWITAVAALAVPALLFGPQRGTEDAWQDPLAGARYTRLTDMEGVAPSVAISRDGARIAFLANREGRLDAWLAQADGGGFRNLTQGRVPEMDNPVRSLAFTPDGLRVAVWARVRDAAGEGAIHTWSVPVEGGVPGPYLDNVAEVDWSRDGLRMVHHPAAPGDPLFVATAHQPPGRQIYIAPNGVHCHFPVWSPDDRYIYFVMGRPPDDMDVWRIAVDGGEPERITHHASRVSHPVFLDGGTLLYLATDQDGGGPWLHGLDPERRVSHRLGGGMASFTALAASADGQRLVATRTTRRTSLWRVPITGEVTGEADATRVALPAAGGHSPRLGPGYLLFVSPSDGSGLRRLSADGQLSAVWKGGTQRLLAGPAIDPVRQRIAITTSDGQRARLQVMEADGSARRVLAPHLQVRGAPAWSPDGQSVVVAAEQGQDMRLFRVPADGAPAGPLAAGHSRDAVWSPDGRFVVFGGADVGPTFPLQALSADGRPHAVPALQLPRGARRMVFLPGGRALVVLKGAAHDRNFWRVDLDTGEQRALTDFGSGFAIGDFDVTANGREIVFDQQREESDVVRIDLAPRRKPRRAVR